MAGFCLSISGYSAAADVDHNGDDITRAASTEQAAASCSAIVSCSGFNSWGFVKRAVWPTQPFMGMCLYTKQAVGRPSAGACHTCMHTHARMRPWGL